MTLTESLPDIHANGVPSVPLGQVTDLQLSQYADLVYQRTGIRVSPQKKTLLSNRVRRRLRETGIPGFREYYVHLRQLPADHPEWDAFLQEITTHETYLFRDKTHWEWFRQVFLPRLGAEARAGQRPRRLRIWSAACSTGDEPLTAACCIADALTDLKQWKILILGTDIGIGALEQARHAAFGERAMKHVPPTYRTRFFSKTKGVQQWEARGVLTSMVTFRQHNLLDPLREMPFDLVFLKNVLIYFDRASKERVMENVRAAIRPGGLLVGGAAEGITEMVKDFVRVQPWLYQRPQP